MNFTDEDRKKAREGLHDIYKKVPEVMRSDIETYVEEYETRVSLESKFVDALDKIEPAFELFRAGGAERVINGMGFSKETLEGYNEIKFRATKDFPYLSRFTYVMIRDFMNQYYG
jgi:5'-deoxynucleotidase YfbR-like HD superfamily hydrolase